MAGITEIASGLRFPEGPIALADGSVLVVEIARGTLSRVTPNGKIEVIADLGGGPNGAAIGPDGACYVCNNGGFEWHEEAGTVMPGGPALDYAGGSIQRVDLATGRAETLYTECDGLRLRGPNDLVFDRHGGFYFTDFGKVRTRDMDRSSVYYARADGSLIREVVAPLHMANGVGLSPDEDRLYVAETLTGRLWAYEITAPGEVKGGIAPGLLPSGTPLIGLPGLQLFDSLAVDGDGFVCVATLVNGGITRISADGDKVLHVPMPDPFTTNICFGGPRLQTAYITLSLSGKLIATEWLVPGLPLNYLNR